MKRVFASRICAVTGACWLAATFACSEGHGREVGAGKLNAALIAAPPPGVAALIEDLGRVYCSGSLISPRVVLTAAHCVLRDGRVRLPFAVYFGADARTGGRYERVHSALVHPDYDPVAFGSDLALLRLGDEVDLPALGLDWTAPVPEQAIAFSGFGESEEGGAGYRHDEQARVLAVYDDTFSYSPATCFGDSGGPVLAEGAATWTVIGVASTALLCTVAQASPVGQSRGWLEAALSQLDPASCRSDGSCDPSCPYGDRDCSCADDEVCQACSGEDVDCTSECGSDGECSEGCLLPDPDCSARDVDAQCQSDLECQSGLCHGGRCLQRCSTELTLACPPWLSCLPLDSASSACQSPPRENCSLPARTMSGMSAATHLLALWAIAATARRRRR